MLTFLATHRVCLRDGSACTMVPAATLRTDLTKPHCTLTPSQPVLTLMRFFCLFVLLCLGFFVLIFLATHRVCLRDGSAWTVVPAATLRSDLTEPHCTLTPSQPVLTLMSFFLFVCFALFGFFFGADFPSNTQSVSQRRISLDSGTCGHIEIRSHQASLYTDTKPTTSNADEVLFVCFVCFFVLTFLATHRVCLRDGSACTMVPAATLRSDLTKPHCTLTPSQPVLMLRRLCHACALSQ